MANVEKEKILSIVDYIAENINEVASETGRGSNCNINNYEIPETKEGAVNYGMVHGAVSVLEEIKEKFPELFELRYGKNIDEDFVTVIYR